jgi:hypothetical protein
MHYISTTILISYTTCNASTGAGDVIAAAVE